jgi:predicted DCC family thiol-disulfide oxidoreductase YuxK
MTKGRIPIKPYQFIDLEEIGIPLQDAQGAVQFLNAGERYQGARAIAEAMISSRTGWAVAGWFIKTPVILSFAELVYSLVAKNRHRLPGGTPACKLDY